MFPALLTNFIFKHPWEMGTITITLLGMGCGGLEGK